MCLQSGSSPLHSAASNGFAEVATLLLDRGAVIGARNDVSGVTAMAVALSLDDTRYLACRLAYPVAQSLRTHLPLYVSCAAIADSRYALALGCLQGSRGSGASAAGQGRRRHYQRQREFIAADILFMCVFEGAGLGHRRGMVCYGGADTPSDTAG